VEANDDVKDVYANLTSRKRGSRRSRVEPGGGGAPPRPRPRPEGTPRRARASTSARLDRLSWDAGLQHLLQLALEQPHRAWGPVQPRIPGRRSRPGTVKENHVEGTAIQGTFRKPLTYGQGEPTTCSGRRFPAFPTTKRSTGSCDEGCGRQRRAARTVGRGGRTCSRLRADDPIRPLALLDHGRAGKCRTF